jgi:uncharacterized protein YeaO (DUF488 family)
LLQRVPHYRRLARIDGVQKAMKVKIKRIYLKPDSEDGIRILIDRLWPRGLKKEDAKIDLWLKGIAPSTDLRKWFNHDPEKWEEFELRYREELKRNTDQVDLLLKELKESPVTLLFAAKDEEHNEAVVLQQWLKH